MICKQVEGNKRGRINIDFVGNRCLSACIGWKRGGWTKKFLEECPSDGSPFNSAKSNCRSWKCVGYVQEAIKSSLTEGSSLSFLVSSIEEIKAQTSGIRCPQSPLVVDVASSASLRDFVQSQLSLAFQMVGYSLYKEIKEQGGNVEETAFPTLIANAISLCKDGLIPTITPLLVFSNCFEETPVSECERLWRVFVSFRKDFSNPPFITATVSNTQLYILVIVNSLLRRASRMQNSSFRGELMM